MPYYLEEQNSGTDEMPINRELIIKETLQWTLSSSNRL